jgi:hypothetical protein
MPYSHSAPKQWCLDRITELAPVDVLDVGPGAGLWGHAVRRHLPACNLDCIEAHGPYVTRFELDALYDQVFIGDVRHWDWGGCDYIQVAESSAPIGAGTPKWTWDLVILGDVLEHMSMAEAHAVVAEALAHADSVLAVVPVGEWLQDESEGNPLEAHVATWELPDVLTLPKLNMMHTTDTDDGTIAAACLGAWPR